MVSFVWDYFIKIGGTTNASCKIEGCGKVIGRAGESTSGMIRHLQFVHKIQERDSNQSQKRAREENEPAILPAISSKKKEIQTSLFAFVKYSSLEESVLVQGT